MASGDIARAEARLHAHPEGVRKGIQSLALDGETAEAEGDGDGEDTQSAAQEAP